MKRVSLFLVASVLGVLAATIALALTASGPINPSDTAAAINTGAALATALAGHQYQSAVALGLMLLVWIGHQPFAGSLLDKLGRFHNPTLLMVGGFLSAIADKLITGAPFGVSMILGAATAVFSTGLWEHLTDWLPAKHPASPAPNGTK